MNEQTIDNTRQKKEKKRCPKCDRVLREQYWKQCEECSRKYALRKLREMNINA